jgi:RNA polymerase sigma factor (TIGR02999 family)
MSEVTRLLNSMESGDPQAAGQLLPLVYQELRRLAVHRMSREAPGQTLQPTALVHEAWLRLSGQPDKMWQGRAHFFGAAAEAMRRILIENARRRHAARHGGGKLRVDIDEVEIAAPARDEELLAINEALERFSVLDDKKAQLVKLRYFVGLTIEDAAGVMGISVATAKRWWNFARAWLHKETQQGAQP